MVNQVMDRLNRPRPFDRNLFAAARLATLVSGLAALLAASAILASTAVGADRIYWANLTDGLSFANQDGSGAGGDLDTSGATVNFPAGLAPDIGGGRFYWTNSGLGGGAQGISFTNLDGTGAAGDLNTAGAMMNGPVGIATDPAAGRVYWANNGSGTPPFAISYANLDGSGAGGDLNTAGATLDTPAGATLDAPAGRIYWSNSGSSNTISYANLDGSGGGDINTTGASGSAPSGVAIDAAAGRIYWTNTSGEISYANLDDSGGGGDLNTAGATVNFPVGVAIDPAAGRIYWGNSGLGAGPPYSISYANLDDSGGGDLGTAGATVVNPSFPLLLHAPTGTAAPKPSGAHGRRSKISCTQGTWAADQREANLYRAPSSYTYSWSRYAKKIYGASASTYRPHAVGNYRCAVTAHNPAGQALQTTSVHAAFRLAKLYRNKRRGAAKLIVKLPGRGKVSARGAKLKKATPRTHLASKQKHLHKAAILIEAKGAAKRKLRHRGHLKLRVKVSFDPKQQNSRGGTLTRTVTLRFRPPSRRVISASAVFPLGLGRG